MSAPDRTYDEPYSPNPIDHNVCLYHLDNKPSFLVYETGRKFGKAIYIDPVGRSVKVEGAWVGKNDRLKIGFAPPERVDDFENMATQEYVAGMAFSAWKGAVMDRTAAEGVVRWVRSKYDFRQLGY